MKQARRVLGVLAGLLALAILADPVAAQTSVNRELIFGLNRKLLYVGVPITVLVEGILIYTVYRFRNNDEPKPTQENRRLEITWTVATAIILLFVGLASYQILGSQFIGGATATAGTNADQNVMDLSYDYPGAMGPENPDDAVQIEVKAQKYYWQFNHQNPGGENFTVSNELVIPANRTVYLHITSKDWLHAFHAPSIGLKQDAFPAQYNTIVTKVYETGEHQLYCAEYCGVGHSNMLGTIKVVSQEEYQQYLEENAGSGGNASAGDSSGGNSSGNASGNASGSASANASSNASLVTGKPVAQ